MAKIKVSKKVLGILSLLLLIVPVLFASEGSWLNAGDIKEEDYLLNSEGEWVKVKSVQKVTLEEPVKVYNLGVSGFHTYFVGLQGILVHNKPTGLIDEAAEAAVKTAKGFEVVGSNFRTIRPIQSTVNTDIVEEYYQRILKGEKLKPIVLEHVNNVGDYILDGHHRFVAYMRAGVPVEKIPFKYEPHGQGAFDSLLHKYNDWSQVKYVADTAAPIARIGNSRVLAKISPSVAPEKLQEFLAEYSDELSRLHKAIPEDQIIKVVSNFADYEAVLKGFRFAYRIDSGLISSIKNVLVTKSANADNILADSLKYIGKNPVMAWDKASIQGLAWVRKLDIDNGIAIRMLDQDIVMDENVLIMKLTDHTLALRAFDDGKLADVIKDNIELFNIPESSFRGFVFVKDINKMEALYDPEKRLIYLSAQSASGASTKQSFKDFLVPHEMGHAKIDEILQRRDLLEIFNRDEEYRKWLSAALFDETYASFIANKYAKSKQGFLSMYISGDLIFHMSEEEMLELIEKRFWNEFIAARANYKIFGQAEQLVEINKIVDTFDSGTKAQVNALTDEFERLIRITEPADPSKFVADIKKLAEDIAKLTD